MAVSLSLFITQNSQSIANNTSNVTVSVRATWTGGSHNLTGECTGSITIDGKKYSFSGITFNHGKYTEGYQTIMTKTANVSHNDNGTKTLNCSASFVTGVSSGTVGASASKVLTTIPRKSSLSASNGTLGTSQTLTVTKQASSFTHTITYKCGSASGTICTKSSNTSISWTPPLALSSQNTTGTSVSITFTITAYSGNTSLGSNTKSITCSIPASVKPTCSITVTDPTGIYDTYEAFVQGLSKFKVVVTPTTSYGSAISKYKTTANGSTYTNASFTTGSLLTYGTLKVASTVTDKRGRSASASKSLTVLEYTPPGIIKLFVKRCNADGSSNDQGDHVCVTFSAKITNLGNKNSAAYILKYKRSSEGAFTEIPLTDYAGQYAVTDGTYIFPADTGSSYNIELDATDNHNTTARTTTASTGFTLMHWNTAGDGMGIGKVAELSRVLDIGMETRFYGGLLYPTLEPETDLNDVRIPNTYVGENVSSYDYTNCPVASGTFTLIVESCGEQGQVRQTYICCSKYNPQRFVRFYYQSTWGPWMFATTEEVVLYSNDSGSADAITLAYNASNYTYLEIYYTDNNGCSGGYTKVWNPNGKTVHLQMQEPGSSVYTRQTAYSISGTSMTPNLTNASYVRFSSAGAVSTSIGTNYIKIVRVVGLA